MPVLPCAHRAQPSTLTVGASMSCELPAFHSKDHRACVRRALASLSTTALIFLQRGSANPAGRPPPSMAQSRAPRAADSASHISPSSCAGDKRGRMRQSYEAVVFGQCFLWSVVSLKKYVLNSAGMTFSVGTRFEKQNRFRDIGRGVVCGIDWSEDFSTGGEQKSVSFEESCRSRHVTRLWCSSTTTSFLQVLVNSTSWRLT